MPSTLVYLSLTLHICFSNIMQPEDKMAQQAKITPVCLWYICIDGKFDQTGEYYLDCAHIFIKTDQLRV